MAIAAANNQFDLEGQAAGRRVSDGNKAYRCNAHKTIGSFYDQWRLFRLVAGLPKSAIVKAIAKEDASALCRVYSAQCSH